MASVDILLAIYNGAKYLPEQLASLQTQTHTDWRLIVRDDGSSDGSLDLVRAWAGETGRDIVVVEDGDVRLGPAQSFGRLLARSDAPYFAFCDQDDVWKADKLAKLLAAATGYRDRVVLVHCDLEVVDENLNSLGSSLWKMRKNSPEVRQAHAGMRANLLFQNQVTGCAALGNAALRSVMVPFPEAISMHDWWAALTAAFRGRILEVNEPLVLYRQHQGNTLGAQSRSIKKILTRFLVSPLGTIEKVRSDYRDRARQAQAASSAFLDFMTDDEIEFSNEFSSIGSGLRSKNGRRLFLWSFKERRRLPVTLVLLVETFPRLFQKRHSYFQ